MRRLAGTLCAATIVLAGCGESPPAVLEGSPHGPYRLTLTLVPPAPVTTQDTALEFRLARSTDDSPVSDAQIVHERALHTFIVARDFTSFAHLHHEDFAPRTAEDRALGRFRFPYRFPAAGEYRIVSEFVHRERAFSKRFDVRIGPQARGAPAPADLARERLVDGYRVVLRSSPGTPVAGHEAELVFELSRDGVPVTDLGLWLGAEVHLAIWREDGEQFAHSHSYTPAMARMMAAMQGHRMDAAHSAAMMLRMMAAPASLVYPGPVVPVRHVFPTAGRYRLFMQCAPGGKALVVPFVLDVRADDGTAETTLHSIVRSAAP